MDETPNDMCTETLRRAITIEKSKEYNAALILFRYVASHDLGRNQYFAKIALGRFYLFGLGTEKNLDIAEKYFTEVAKCEIKDVQEWGTYWVAILKIHKYKKCDEASESLKQLIDTTQCPTLRQNCENNLAIIAKINEPSVSQLSRIKIENLIN